MGAQPCHLYHIYECDMSGRPGTLRHSGGYKSGPDAVNRWLHSYKLRHGASDEYRRLRDLQRRGLLVGMAEEATKPTAITARVPVRVVIKVPAATATSRRPPQRQLALL